MTVHLDSSLAETAHNSLGKLRSETLLGSMKLLHHNLADPRSRLVGKQEALKIEAGSLRPDKQGVESERETLAKTRVPLSPKVYTIFHLITLIEQQRHY